MPEPKPGTQKKLMVLVSGTLPPPVGGMAVYYQTLLDSSLPERVDLAFVQTSSQEREPSSTGKATFSNLVAALRDGWRFTRAILARRPQIAHVGTAAGLSFLKHSYCVCLAKLLGCRVILHPHCSLAALYDERPAWWRAWFAWVVRRTDGIVALSQEWLQLPKKVPGCRVHYLPNGVDLKLYRAICEKRLADDHRRGQCRVLYLGQLGEAKGSFELLEAARAICSQGWDVVFDLVGGELAPGDFGRLRARAGALELDGRVRLHGPAYEAEKFSFLRDADIFVYPSHYEGMPMAVLEAMACGLPVVASRVGGLPDLIQDGFNGLLVDPGNVAQLASAIGRLARDPGLYYTMKKASYQRVCEQYDIEQHVAQLASIYAQVMTPGGKR